MRLLAALALTLGVAACGGGDDTDRPAAVTGGGSGGNAIVSNPDNGKVSLTIGSKNFPEQKSSARSTPRRSRRPATRSRRDLNLGSETVALKALKSGDDLAATRSTRAPR